ncbi:MAG TPA: DEAD/DEAH box helicase [Burkholderiales bacterium]|nr:DEAD/DEAH box helicase [Burkholderiales bacterium]
MGHHSLIEQFHALPQEEKFLVAALATHDTPLSKTRLLECLRKVGVSDIDGTAYTAARLSETLTTLRKNGVINEATGIGFTCANEIIWPAIQSAMADGVFEKLFKEARSSWGNSYSLGSYSQALTRLRLTMLTNQSPEDVRRRLEDCARYYYNPDRSHPYVEICGQPFDSEFFGRLHPMIQQEAFTILLAHSAYEPELALPLRNWLEKHLVPAAKERPLRTTLAEHWLLCGRLNEAWSLVEDGAGAIDQFLRGAIRLLRGDPAGALTDFETAMKALRKELGQRNVSVVGICGYLYALTLMRAKDTKIRKSAEVFLDAKLREAGPDSSVYSHFQLLRQGQAGTLKAGDTLEEIRVSRPLAQLFQVLVYYWLGLKQLEAKQPALEALRQSAESAGFYFIAAQAAELLGRMGQSDQGEWAASIRRKYGFADLSDWFERQESWQRQLAALVRLQPASAAKTKDQTRLVWLIEYDPEDHQVDIEPREQKRDARGAWSKGRPLPAKRLQNPDEIEYATPQDERVFTALNQASRNFFRNSWGDNDEKALVALIGHPLVFWQDAPDTRVELIRGEPELLVQQRADKLKISLQPVIDSDENIMVVKETPTRLRIIEITEEHRRIVEIIGKGLNVPAHAKEHVMHAVSAISPIVTVQSEIGGVAENIEQIEADHRLHVHLLPHEGGLRLRILVRPFANGGAYYQPAQGAESVIAEIDGKPRQARRDLDAEGVAAKKLITDCPALEYAEQIYGEWLLAEPEQSLELLLQLQAQADNVVIAWPEGEKFKVGPQVHSSQFRLSIKRENSWFAAGGELKLNEDKVLDLRALLELVAQNPGRFVSLGGNEFLALTVEFRRRLDELRSFSDLHEKGVRVHPLAAFGLEDLSNDVGQLKADKHWKQHIERLRELDTLEPQLPSTLQAELRDYQQAGFAWLCRLAHWGVGACLADDMGLGKTLQALALLLTRAAEGPALVVAPTSVCMNWVAEAARFAPTLNTVLYGAGNREKTLADAKPLDLIVVSYSLLQQDAERFTTVQWHTIVLDEAQAIKNKDTKRSQAAMALSGDFKLITTGTPLENHLGELWNLYRFINPGLLGSLEQFNQRFAAPIEKQQDVTARNNLRKLIQPFILRRTKNQVLSELPPRTEILRYVDLSEDESALYEALRRQALAHIAGMDTPAGQKHIQILAEIMKLRRACCNPQLVAPELALSSSKLAAFGELVDELLDNRHKALVFSQFVDHLHLIRAYLDERGVAYQYLDGATPMQQRKARVDAFQAGEGDIFLISLKAGGTGLNLTAADYVIHMDPWWNPAVEDQASDRAHRMGQQRPVTIYRLVAKNTIEEKIVDLHQHKRALADSLLEGADVSGRMSAEDLLLLLQEELKRQ